MRFEILLAPQAVEDLRHLAAHERAEVKDAIERYLRQRPMTVSKSRIKRLQGVSRTQYRLRVGDVRVFYDVVEGVVEVVAIVPKRGATAWLERAGE